MITRTAKLTRRETGDQGTFGEFVTDSGFHCFTGELPWRENASGKSCIPAGTYGCLWLPSPKHGPCYHVTQVSGRTDIEIHGANLMGDKALGFQCQLLGCIAPGTELGYLDKQRAVLNSHEALAALVRHLGTQGFMLTIKDAE